jgi:hypothetical protein
LLPRHDDFSLSRRALAVTAIATASALLTAIAYRVSVAPMALTWWLLPSAAAGMLAADFVSGLVHWAADTWGSEGMPLIGRRLLHPFRVHHVNPDDFLRRRFIDTNGDVAIVVIPVLATALWLPLDSQPGVAAIVFLGSFAAIGLCTNQVHQWAHMPRAPFVVRLLQHGRLILTHEAHGCHHRAPHTANYCIATGWCNRPLAALGFFERLERALTWLTGVRPRHDDNAFRGRAGEEGDVG